MLWAAFISFIVALAAVRLLLSRFGRLALDQPNERSLHASPVPRTGGLAVLAGMASAVPFVGTQLHVPLLLAYGLAAISFYDDVHGLPTRIRLLAHSTAACVLVWYILSPMSIVQLIVLFLAVVWITNLYNFMDGSDGLAGGMAVIGFSTYSAAAWLAGEIALAGLCGAVAGAALAFLTSNFHPARIFLGDVGSIPLGFLAAALGIVGWRGDAWPLWFPLLAFGPFMGDATATLLKRLVRGQRVWQAHREHYYQRIVRMGFGHRRTALIGYVLMLLCAGAAMLGRVQAPAVQAALFGGTALLLAGMAVWVDRRWARFATTA
jgi:UDP-N-acetylmuramyl pentapeptide phosphotransferase/UDP-N-acetylglucosamine-1-phosphate transferase